MPGMYPGYVKIAPAQTGRKPGSREAGRGKGSGKPGRPASENKKKEKKLLRVKNS